MPRHAAILSVDIVGYSILMAANEADTQRRVELAMKQVRSAIHREDGSIFSFAGDAVMAAFDDAVAATRCALHIQGEAARAAAALRPNQRIRFRLGIHAGTVLGRDIFTGSNAVNTAVRLQELAEPGGILVSETVYDAVRAVIGAPFEGQGQPDLKNLQEPVAVFAISAATCRTLAGVPQAAGRHAIDLVDPPRDPRAALAVPRLQEPRLEDLVRRLDGYRDLLAVVRVAAAETGDPRRLRQALNIRYVLRAERCEEMLILELTDAETARLFHADRLEDAVEERIAERVFDQERARLAEANPDSLSPYHLVLLARDLMAAGDAAGMFDAGGLLRRATALQPDFVPAQTELAWWHVQSGDADGLAQAATALARCRNDARAVATLGYVRFLRDGDRAAAEASLRRAAALNPTCPWISRLGAAVASS